MRARGRKMYRHIKGSGTQWVLGVQSSARQCRKLPTHCRLPTAASGRRGVLLLVILSLLILFVMIALTYVLVATRHLQASRANARVATTGEPPQELLEGAAMQVA